MEAAELAVSTGRAGGTTPRCRFCDARLEHTLVDLGMSPLCESYRRADQLDALEPFYPLHVRICERCLLAQLPAYVPPEEIFSDYAYYSSYSVSWVEHARRFVDAAIERLGLGPESLVLEVASNDGYLLQHAAAKGIPVLGVEPAANIAEVARARGIPTEVAFFGHKVAARLVEDGQAADLVVGNNVISQVPDLNDFVTGLRAVLRAHGVLTLEFPDLARLIEGNQYDTIYHEHFSYLSFLTALRVLEAHDLRVFDVEELPTHGGSLRVWAQRADTGRRPVEARVHDLAARQEADGYRSLEVYASFQARVEESKCDLLEHLIEARRRGKLVAGYGAPGKGNTLLNYCGVRTDLLAFTVDRSPHKQGLFLPGTHIPIYDPEHIGGARPDEILILPWNLRDEIAAQLAYTRDWGARLFIPIPTVEIVQ